MARSGGEISQNVNLPWKMIIVWIMVKWSDVVIQSTDEVLRGQ